MCLVDFYQDSIQLSDMQSFMEVDLNSDNASVTSEDTSNDITNDVSLDDQDGTLSADGTNNNSNDINNHMDGGREREQPIVY